MSAPGSPTLADLRAQAKQRPPAALDEREDPHAVWDTVYVELEHDGAMVKFFKLTALAMALNRQPGTLRKWERVGWMPAAVFRTPVEEGSDFPGHRLYTRRFIELAVKAASRYQLPQEGHGGARYSPPIGFVTALAAAMKLDEKEFFGG